MEIYTAFYCELQRNIDQMIQLIFFKYFWTNANKPAWDDEEFEASEIPRLRASEISRLECQQVTFILFELSEREIRKIRNVHLDKHRTFIKHKVKFNAVITC